MNDGRPDPVADALRLAHIGPIVHDGPGRTDDSNMHVKGESFVIPADVVSALGEGNTANGFKLLEKMFPSKGINRKSGGTVPIVAAGGEFVVPPEHVQRIGDGSMKRGHEILREFVIHARKQAINTLRKLPNPVRK